MMTDLVSRARVRAKMVEGQRAHGDEVGLTSSLLRELADEIDRLREALEAAMSANYERRKSDET
jgi:hypothetical protein